MKKEDLVALALNLTEEQINKILAASEKELEAYVPKTKFEEVESEKKHLEEINKTSNKQLEELKKGVTDVESLKVEIQKMQDLNKAKEAEYATNLKNIKVENAVEMALIGAKAKNNKAVKALLNLEGLELGEDGKLKGLDKQLDSLLKDESTAFLFNTNKVDLKGAAPAGGNKEVDFKSMTYSQIEKYMAENPGTKIEI